jgi:hypothetical protein
LLPPIFPKPNTKLIKKKKLQTGMGKQEKRKTNIREKKKMGWE